MKSVLTAIVLAASFVLFAQDNDHEKVVQVPTVMILPFEVQGNQPDREEGKSIVAMLNAGLMKSRVISLIEQDELNRIISELHLPLAMLTDSAIQLKLARATGTKILISGTFFNSGEKDFMIVKMTGAGTNKVLACSASAPKEDNHSDILPELTRKTLKILETETDKLLPPKVSASSVAANLTNKVKGKQRTVYIKINEDTQSDPTLEIELKSLLLALDFKIAEEQGKADFTIVEARATPAGDYLKLPAATASVELSVYRKDSTLLATETAKEVFAGTSYDAAAKEAIAQTALRLASTLFTCMN